MAASCPSRSNRSNLDLLGTTHEMPKVASVAGTIALLDGILASQAIEQIAAAMEKSGNEAIEAVTDPTYTKAVQDELHGYMKNLIVHEGVGDNPVAAAGAAGP